MKNIANILKSAPTASHWSFIFPDRNNLSVTSRFHYFHILFVCVLLLANKYTFAQTNMINNDLQQINIAMFEQKNLYMEIDYRLYFDQSVRSQMTGTIKKKDKMLFQQIGEITVIKNKDHSLFVHPQKKLLVIDPNHTLKDPVKKEDILRINIDTLKSWIMGTELTEQNGLKILTFTLKRGEYSRIVIEYDPVSYFLKKMQLYARNIYTSIDKTQSKIWMEIVFVKTSVETDFSNEDFSMEKYVTIKNDKKISVAPNFRRFTLINNLPKKITYDKK